MPESLSKSSKSISNSSTNGRGIVYLEVPIRIGASTVLEGYNLYHSSTVVRCKVSFNAPLQDATTASVGREFASRFLERFSQLPSFAPNNGIADELIERMNSIEGIGFPEVLLEATLALECALAFMRHDMGRRIARIRRIRGRWRYS